MLTVLDERPRSSLVGGQLLLRTQNLLSSRHSHPPDKCMNTGFETTQFTGCFSGNVSPKSEIHFFFLV